MADSLCVQASHPGCAVADVRPTPSASCLPHTMCHLLRAHTLGAFEGWDVRPCYAQRPVGQSHLRTGRRSGGVAGCKRNGLRRQVNPHQVAEPRQSRLGFLRGSFRSGAQWRWS